MCGRVSHFVASRRPGQAAIAILDSPRLAELFRSQAPDDIQGGVAHHRETAPCHSARSRRYDTSMRRYDSRPQSRQSRGTVRPQSRGTVCPQSRGTVRPQSRQLSDGRGVASNYISSVQFCVLTVRTCCCICVCAKTSCRSNVIDLDWQSSIRKNKTCCHNAVG